MWLSILTWEDDPGLFEWAHLITVVFIKRKQDSLRKRKERCDDSCRVQRDERKGPLGQECG